MKRKIGAVICVAMLCLSLAGCSGIAAISGIFAQTSPAEDSGDTGTVPASSQAASAQVEEDGALVLALENAGVPEEDAYNIKVERDREQDTPVYKVEFETEYGDYDFAVTMAEGRIIDADYEVDEEWLERLGGQPVTPEEAKDVVQSKVPGSNAGDVQLREEKADGRGRYEGELFFDGIKYEFEIDSQTGIILDWKADLRK